MATQRDGVANLARGFSYLFASQASTRLITFAMNQGVVRLITTEDYGLLTVQLPLLTSTILFISREGFRRGCLRTQVEGKEQTAEHDKRELQSILSVSKWCLAWGLLVAAALTGSTVLWAGPSTPPAVLSCYIMHGMACVVELLSEPLYISAKTQLRWRLLAGIEGAAAIVRCALLLGMLWLSNPGGPLEQLLSRPMVFSLSQLAYAVAVLLGYLWYAWGLAKMVPILLGNRWGPAEKERARLTATFTGQAVGKQLLSEASKLVLVLSGSSGLYDQGVYGLVSNLGSLVVRVLLQPIEETAFTHFSLVKVQQGDKAKLAHVASTLRVLLRAVTIIGLLATAFGPAYSYTALLVLYGQYWSSTKAPLLLSLYCPYILVLAVNGVTEAFVHAVLDGKRLLQSNKWLLLSFLLHMGMSVVLIQQYSTFGLVLADMCNMVLRIATSLWYILLYFQPLGEFRLTSLAPSMATLAACGGAAAVTQVSRHYLAQEALLRAGQHMSALAAVRRLLPHIGVGGLTLVLLLAVLFKTEGGTIKQLRGLRRQPAGAAAASKQD